MSLQSGALSSPLFSPSTVRAPGRELGIGPVNPNPLQQFPGGNFGRRQEDQNPRANPNLKPKLADLAQFSKFVPQFTPQEKEAIRNNFSKQSGQFVQDRRNQFNSGTSFGFGSSF